MKNLLFACLSLGLALAPSTSNAENNYSIVSMIPASVFAPTGFDDNDNAQIVIDGIYPDSCHSNGPLRFKVDSVQNEIQIQNGVIVADGKCQMMLGSYTRVLELGPLSVGQYKLVFLDSAQHRIEKGVLAVKNAASPSSDEFFYAPVKNVQLDAIDEQTSIVLSGVFTNSCLNMKSVEVIYNPEVIEILPIAQFQGTNCKQEQRPFSMIVKLKDNLQGKKLVHVRSLNGQAINQVYSF